MPIATTILEPRIQPFDSGLIAPRVGHLFLSESATVDDNAAGDLVARAAASGFDLVWIESQSRLETTRWDYRGTIVELNGERDAALSSIRLATGSCDIRSLESDADWALVEESLRFAATSRFTTDPHIAEASFRRHKMSLLKSHVENRQGMISIAHPERALDHPIGYTCFSIHEGTASVYDLAVDPEHRRASVALRLLQHALQRLTSAHPDIRKMTTRIYDDNAPCLRLFENLGFVRTGRLFHYYHCWPGRP